MEVDRCIARRRLLQKGEVVVVAVSGGVDSMVLLEVLLRLSRKRKNNWSLHVAHLNHRLRGRASNEDEALVSKTAREAGLRFHVAKADVRKLAGSEGISIEMAARKLRHDFLARTARKVRARTVALAHHGDDQVEHFFLKLFRGGGGEAFAGMKWSGPSPADSAVCLIRPLLGQTKAELLTYAETGRLPFREDATNQSSDFERNRIRNELLPLLRKQFRAGLNSIITRVMEIVSAESDFVSEVASAWLIGKEQALPAHKARRSGDGTLGVPTASFDSLSVAVQRKCLMLQLQRMGVAADFDLIEFLRLNPGQNRSVTAGWLRIKETGKLKFSAPVPEPFTGIRHVKRVLADSGTLRLAGRKISWEIQKGKPLFRRRRARARKGETVLEYFDADRIGKNFIVRHWQTGDRFQPIGLSVSKKLQDIFTNAKTPKEKRHELILAENGGGQIFWVEGLRIADPFKITERSVRFLKWRVERRGS